MILRLIQIYKDNESTYYNYASGDRQPTHARKLILLCLSAIIAACLGRDVKDIVELIITVQAILIGFSFSVMFFLVEERQEVPVQSGSREYKLRQRQMSKLCKEIFWNISYFNIVSLMSMATALFLLIPSPMRLFAKEMAVGSYTFAADAQLVGQSVAILFAIGKFLFTALLLDSAYSFARIVGRVNFLFEKRMSADA